MVVKKNGPENKGSGITMVIEKKLAREKKWPEKKNGPRKKDVDLTGSAFLVGVRAISHSSHSDGCCSPVLLILAPQIVAFAYKQRNEIRVANIGGLLLSSKDVAMSFVAHIFLAFQNS